MASKIVSQFGKIKWNSAELVAVMTLITGNVRKLVDKEGFELCIYAKRYFGEAFYSLGVKPPEQLKLGNVRAPARSQRGLRNCAMRFAAWMQEAGDSKDDDGDITHDGTVRRLVTGGFISDNKMQPIIDGLGKAGLSEVQCRIPVRFVVNASVNYGSFKLGEEVPESKEVTVIVIDDDGHEILRQKEELEPDWDSFDYEDYEGGDDS